MLFHVRRAKDGPSDPPRHPEHEDADRFEGHPRGRAETPKCVGDQTDGFLPPTGHGAGLASFLDRTPEPGCAKLAPGRHRLPENCWHENESEPFEPNRLGDA